MSTGFVWHEKYMWHDTGSGAASNIEPDEHFENADTKRRLKNLLDLSGLSDELIQLKPSTPAISHRGLCNRNTYLE